MTNVGKPAFTSQIKWRRLTDRLSLITIVAGRLPFAARHFTFLRRDGEFLYPAGLNEKIAA